MGLLIGCVRKACAGSKWVERIGLGFKLLLRLFEFLLRYNNFSLLLRILFL